jgi:hypothetical protein
MMPQVLSVRVRSARGRRVRLWIPLLPTFLLLSPLLAIVLVALVIACLATRVDPLRALRTGWRLLCSLGGAQFEIDQNRTSVLVHFN